MSVATLKAMGARDVVLEDFATLAAATNRDGSRRFHPQRVLAPLARFIGGQGGRQRDLPLYELCHLVAAVNLLAVGRPSGAGAATRQLFFFGQESLSATRLREWFRQCRPILTSRPLTEPKSGVTCSEHGICLVLGDDGVFRISFNRMPFLIAVYEYLLSMNSFSYYSEFTQLFDQLGGAGDDAAALRDIINRITSTFRRYRRDMVDWARYEDKFNAIFSYLTANSEDKVCDITDDTIAAFWRQHFHRKDFKRYATVFGAFADFINVVENADRRVTEDDRKHQSAFDDRAAVPETVSDMAWPDAEWQSPIAALDDAPVNRIRYLTANRERRRLEPLMRHGPVALRLPRAFLRGEGFGPVQDGIRNDLQLGRGEKAVEKRLGCHDAVPYDAIASELAALHEHCEKLMRADYFVLTHTAAEQAEAQVDTPQFEAAKKAFAAINRQGFRTADLQDPDIVAGHATGAEAILTMSSFLERFLAVLSRRGLAGPASNRLFAEDLPIFQEAFQVLYGADK